MAPKKTKASSSFSLIHFFLLYGFLILLRRGVKVKINGGKMKLGAKVVDLTKCGEGELSLNGMAMVS